MATKYGVVDAFATIGAPSFLIEGNDKGKFNVSISAGEAHATVSGFETVARVTACVRIVQMSMSILNEESNLFDLAYSMLSMFASRSYIMQDEPADEIGAEEFWVDGQIEDWQIERAGL